MRPNYEDVRPGDRVTSGDVLKSLVLLLILSPVAYGFYVHWALGLLALAAMLTIAFVVTSWLTPYLEQSKREKYEAELAEEVIREQDMRTLRVRMREHPEVRRSQNVRFYPIREEIKKNRG
jgi:hypothetical protein